MNSPILPRYSVEFSEKKMGNRGKIGEDGIWELTVLATCGPNSQNSPRFSIIY